MPWRRSKTVPVDLSSVLPAMVMPLTNCAFLAVCAVAEELHTMTPAMMTAAICFMTGWCEWVSEEIEAD